MADETINIRKIENGYIVRKECYGKSGYKSVETFTPTKPEIELGEERKAKAKPRSNSLAQAKKALR